MRSASPSASSTRTSRRADRATRALRVSRGANEQCARPVSEVRDLSAYRAVVLGSAVYAKRWRPDARKFARRHADALRDIPVWLFSSGPIVALEEHPTAPMPPFAEKLAARIGAREHVMFGGRVPLDPGNFVERAMLKKTPPERRDARDWPAIEAWARGVAAALQPERALDRDRQSAAPATC